MKIDGCWDPVSNNSKLHGEGSSPASLAQPFQGDPSRGNSHGVLVSLLSQAGSLEGNNCSVLSFSIFMESDPDFPFKVVIWRSLLR